MINPSRRAFSKPEMKELKQDFLVKSQKGRNVSVQRKMRERSPWKANGQCSKGAKIREKKGPSQGIIQTSEPQERIPWAPRFEERTQNETLRQERCARGAAWKLAKDA